MLIVCVHVLVLLEFQGHPVPHNIGTLDIHVLTNPAALVDVLICQPLRLSGVDVLNLDNHPTVLLWKACFEKINLKLEGHPTRLV